MVAPDWHKSAFYSENYQKVRTGLYSEEDIELEPYDREYGYEALAEVFSKNSSLKSKANLETMTDVPDEYKKRCFKDIDFSPVPGLFGYIIYTNVSSYALEQKLKIQLEGAEIVWPQAARDFYEFTLVTEPNSNGIILTRKHSSEKATCSISSQLVPRRLSE